MTKKIVTILAAVAMTFALSAPTWAAAIQFDFGSTLRAGDYSGTNGPAQSTGALGAGDTYWNACYNKTNYVSGSDFVWSDGTAATGVTLIQGYSNIAEDPTGPIERVYNGSNLATYMFTYDPLYVPSIDLYNDALMLDCYRRNDKKNMGVAISGLPAGTYNIYAITRAIADHSLMTPAPESDPEVNTLALDYLVDFTLNVNHQDEVATAVTDATGITTWVENKNYALGTITTTSESDTIWTIVAPGRNTNIAFTHFQGLQIVPVPEPSSIGLLLISSLGFLGLRRRR